MAVNNERRQEPEYVTPQPGEFADTEFDDAMTIDIPPWSFLRQFTSRIRGLRVVASRQDPDAARRDAEGGIEFP